ncbi:hypothetical protein BH11MYX3_BH11MYX3_10350 [soil metagenome]
MERKRRLSVSVDAELMDAAELSVKRGEAPTLSAYVSDGLKQKLQSDQRLRAMDDFLEEYEREYGNITEEGVAESVRELQSRALHVRPARPARSTQRYATKQEAARTASRASERRSRR